MPAAQDADPLVPAARARATTRALDIGLLVDRPGGRCGRSAALVLGREALPSPLATVSQAHRHHGRRRLSAPRLGDRRAPSSPRSRSRWSRASSSGLALGAHRLSGEVAEPILVALYSIPKITLYPVILLLFGLGISAKIAFGVIHGIIPVILFTMNAVRNIRAGLSARRARHAADARCRPPRPSSCRPRCRRSCPASASASR